MRRKLQHLLAVAVLAVMLPESLPAQEVVMEEDFAKFSAGTPDQADETQIGNDDEDPYGEGLLDAYTVLPGWQGYGVYQAGGTCVVKGMDFYGQPIVSHSSPEIAFPGNTKITVRARIYPGSSVTSYPMRLVMRQGWTKNEVKTVDITAEWQDIEWENFFSGNWSMTLSLGDEATSTESIPALQIDYIKAVDLGGAIELPAPVATEATSVRETSFTANWNSVSAAESYLLYVESIKNGQTTLVVDGLEVPPASWGMPYKKMTDLDPDAFHTYYVKAKAGDNISEASNKIDVVYMPIIEPTAATAVTADGFTANWKATPKAKSYKVNIYRVTPAGHELFASKTTDSNSCAVEGLKEDGAFWYAYDVASVAELNGKTYESVASRRQVVSMSDVERKTERVLEEDFSRLTNGSEDNIYYKDYDPQDQSNEGPYVNLWASQGNVIPDKYTQTPGWTGEGVAEAGGVAACSYMPYPSTYYGGRITTPTLPLNGLVTLKFRARAITQYKSASAEEPLYIPIYLNTKGDAEYDLITFSEGIEQTISQYEDYDGLLTREERLAVKLTDNDWHEYTVSMLNYSKGDASLTIGSASDQYAAFFIDDITLDLGLTSLPVPQAAAATDFTADGFTANWQAVEKADDYLLSVYRRKAGKNDYAYTDIPVEGLFFAVTGLDPESDYMYTVKARSGVVVSGESRPVTALGISQPVLLEASGLNETGFTANWNRTPKATRYTLKVFAGTQPEGEPAATKEIEDGITTSFAVTGLDIQKNKKFCYQLTAYYDTASETYESLPSDVMTVDLTGMGVSFTGTDNGIVIGKDTDAIRILLPEPIHVIVARADGTVVKSAVLPEGESIINVVAGSIYIVKIADKSVKLSF